MTVETIITVLSIIGIDIVLGGDNAIVIAMACRNLPKHQRNKAIIFGSVLAIVLRTMLTIFAMMVLQIPFLTVIGGILLIGIAIGLVMDDKNENVSVQAGATLSSAISTIVLADIVMGLDNVLAVAGAANGNFLFVLLGLIISIPIIISGSKLVLYLFDKIPFFMYIGAGILAYTAGKMIASEEVIASMMSWMVHFIPLLTVIVVLCWSVIAKRMNYSFIRK